MDSINVRDLSYLMDQTTAKSFSMICSVVGEDSYEMMKQFAGVVPLDFSCSVDAFDSKYGAILSKCIHSIKTSLVTDKACMQNLYKYITVKAKMKKDGGIPDQVTLPPVLKKIFSNEEYAKLVEVISIHLAPILTKKYHTIKIV